MSPAQSIPRRGYNIVEKEPSHRTLRRNQNLFKRSNAFCAGIGKPIKFEF